MTHLEMIIPHLNHRSFPSPAYWFDSMGNLIEVGIYKDVKFLHKLLRLDKHNKKLTKIKSS